MRSACITPPSASLRVRRLRDGCRLAGLPGAALSIQRRLTGGLTTGANYTISRCEGLISQGQAPLNVATGYSQPVSMLNPPSEDDAQKIYDIDKGRCDSWREHIFNLTASIRTPEFSNTTARVLLSDWSLAGVFRAQSGQPLTITTGTDRALSGMQASIQRATQVGDDPYGDKSITNWFNPSAFAQPALGTYRYFQAQRVRRSWLQNPRPLARPAVPDAEEPSARGAYRGVQRAQLVHPRQPEHGPERSDVRPYHLVLGWCRSGSCSLP